MKRFSTRMAAALAVAILVGVMAAAVASATVPADQYDADGNGSADASVREFGLFSTRQVGAECTYSNHGSTLIRTITIRPPAVNPIDGLASEAVAWRAEFYSPTGTTYVGNWVAATATRTLSAEFGGSGDAPGFNIFASSYWNGSESMSNTVTGPAYYPYVQVAWLVGNQLVIGTMQVLWGYSSSFGGFESLTAGC